ncbi:hypothetical protein G3M48_008556 [Beauveria asiatica]|uniref:Protein kinase domain-containing protein n=1 Tax=Beauveria asiatica TaxID=1069075 RepID=A0AAW0RKI2_9HYPO
MKDILIGERYRIDKKIGEGGFGLVYAGIDMKLGDEVAIKLMHVNNDPEIIKSEADTYNVLAGGVGIPRTLQGRPFGGTRRHEVLHPFIYLNYANKGQDPFASYGWENKQKLLKIQKDVDSAGIFTSKGLWTGFFKPS